MTDLVRRSDPRKLAYSNLLPTYATTDQLGAPTYRDYLEQYVAPVHPSFLSFDHYALFKPSGVRADYFYNWVLVRNRVLASGLSLWGFILACEQPCVPAAD